MRQNTLNKMREDYEINNLTYSELGKKYHKRKAQIKYIIVKNKWHRVRNTGHKNALGNKGGYGAKFFNNNASLLYPNHGVYSSIWYSLNHNYNPSLKELITHYFFSMKNCKRSNLYDDKHIKKELLLFLDDVMKNEDSFYFMAKERFNNDTRI